MDGKIDVKTKKERADILENLKNKMFTESREKYLGKTLKVLVEEEKEGFFQGYTENYLKVKFKSNKNCINKILEISIKSLNGEELIGEENYES